MNPSYNGSFGTGNPGGQVPGGFGSGSFGGVPQGMTPQGFASQGQPIGSGGGDIVLNTNNSNQGRKKRAVVVFAVLAVLVVFGLIGLLIGNMSNRNNGTSLDTRTAFNRYANYFLYGEDKTDEITESLDGEHNSYFNKMIAQLDSSEEYLKNVKLFFEDFYGKYLSENDDEEDINAMDSYRNELGLIVNYYTGASVTFNDLLRAYSEGGEGNAKQVIDEKLAPYSNLKDSLNVEYYNNAREMADYDLQYLLKYVEKGCVLNGTIDYSCAIEKSVSSESEDIINNSSRKYYDLLAIRKTCIDDINIGLFGIKDRIFINEE